MNNDSLRNLKGIGEKTEKLFAKLGITTMQQLLHNYPREYDLFTHPVPVRDIRRGEICSVLVRIPYAPTVKGPSQAKSVILLLLHDGSVSLQLTWFHMPFLRTTLKRDSLFIFRGKVQEKNNRLCMEQPEIYTPAQYEQLERSLQPIYALTKGLNQKTMAKAIRQLLETSAPGREYLPDRLRKKLNLCEINYALEKIHFPQDRDELYSARRRLCFEEFFFFLLVLYTLKAQTEDAGNEFPMKPIWTTEDVIENLPYKLTNAQTCVWKELQSDLCSHSRMSRLIQGDVGSGKTILAFLSMILAAENGWQSALMVPTEVLAEQHYQSLNALLAQNHLDQYKPYLLTGSTKASERKKIYADLEDGTCKMVVGTHALIQEKVNYKNLALVITDEQHRFGVRQRTALAEKGRPPHVLVMSATPIPRTLALILYGDLSISVLDELPANRLPIKNCVVDESYRKKSWRFIANQAALGHQAYVICPMVEESEALEAENVTDYSVAIQQALPDLKIGVLHGRMKPEEKNRIMEAFAGGEIQVLVSTTVVEVGVNVPNATVMLIENSERFGLAQLHQLRGRVGRGSDQSYCIFQTARSDDETSERLKVLGRSNDGFYIAEQDLKLRGSGDLLGIRQSGEMEFKIADICRDQELLKAAAAEAKNILDEDPYLESPDHAGIRQVLDDYLARESGEIGI